MTQTTADRKNEPRTAIPVEKLLISHANPHGIPLPSGTDGKSAKMAHSIQAGEEGDVRTEIDLIPAVSSFRVKRSHRVTRTKDGKEVTTWEPIGKPFFLHQSLAVWVPAGEQ